MTTNEKSQAELTVGSTHNSTYRSDVDEQADHARWEAFVTARRWTFAKTYVDKYPHEWTHAKPNTDAEFMWAVDYLNRHGKVERFWGWERPYFYFTGPHGTHRYWTMGAPAHETEIINRCFPDATDYWPRLTPEQATERRRAVWQALERLAAVLPNKRRKGVEAACIAYLYGETDVLPAFAPGG